MEEKEERLTLEQQADRDCAAAVERAKPINDLLETMFFKQFDQLFKQEK
jgi:hypothetical protein